MEKFRLTPTSVGDLDCRKRFFLLRVLKQWPPRTPHLATEFGVAFHAILRHVFDPRCRPLPNLEHLDAWARDAFFARRYPDPSLRDQEMARCIALVKKYVDQEEDAEYTLEVERQGEFPIQVNGKPLFVLSAKLDRVLVRARDRKRLIVRDYKVSRPYRSLEEAFILLWVAKLQYPGYAHYALELDWIGEEGEFTRDTIEGAHLKGMHALVMEKAMRVFGSEEHPAEPGEACCFCPHRPQCQPQRAVNLDLEGGAFEEG